MQNDSKAERIAAAFYFIWFFIHLWLLCYSDENTDVAQFWPFTTTGKSFESTYDVSEFLVYIGSPLVLFIAWKIINHVNPEEEFHSRHHRHISSSFFLAFLDEKIKAESLTQKINELTHKEVNYQYLDELKSDRSKAASRGVNKWFDRMEVKKKYKDYQA